MPEIDRLVQLKAARHSRQNYREELLLEAKSWIEQKIKDRDDEIADIVMAAVNEGYKLVDIAEAYTISGKTPDRNAIYKIRKARTSTAPTTGLPFEWVQTDTGLWRAIGTLNHFGPDDVTGIFQWRYVAGELDPIITEDEPYPYTPYYTAILNNWLVGNPNPGESE
jgi:hypothetical protein